MKINIGIAPLNVDQEELALSNTTTEVLNSDMKQYPTGTATEHCTHVVHRNCKEGDVTHSATNVH